MVCGDSPILLPNSFKVSPFEDLQVPDTADG